MPPILLLLLLALLLAVLSPVSVRRCLSGGPGASTVRKSLLLDEQTTISASATGALIVDTRGKKKVTFRYNVSAITSGVADTNYMTLEILGSNEYGGTYTVLAMLSSPQLIAIGSGQMPDAAAEWPVLPRFIKARWTETGALTGFSAKVWMDFEQDYPGIQYEDEVQSG